MHRTYLSVSMMALAAAGLCGLSIAQPHRIRLGFNVGYLSDGVKYQKARSTLRADGLLLHHRYMGAWMHPNGSASTRTSNWTASLLSEYLDELGVGASATITLSDFPFNVQPDFIVNASLFLDAWAGAPSTGHLADTLRYTNRAPPTRGAWILPQNEATATTALAAYGHEVASLRQLLSVTPNLTGRVDVELGNEPNALGYFWGDTSDWRPIARTARAAMIQETATSPSPQSLLCCAFATELSAQTGGSGGSAAYNSAWGRYARNVTTSTTKTPVQQRLSWHFYRQCSNDRNVNRSTYANASAFFGRASLNGSVLTEWGLFTYNANTTEHIINSPHLTLELARLLRWGYDYHIAEVDFHCLMDDPSKAGHNCYFDRTGDPKLAYYALSRVAALVRNGYVASFDDRFNLTTIVSSSGAQREGAKVVKVMRLVAAAGGYDGEGPAPAPVVLNATRRDRVVASSNFTYDGRTLPAGMWLFIESSATTTNELGSY